MSSVRMVASSYLALLIYALLSISVTTLEFWQLLPALFQLLLGAFAFAVGYCIRKARPTSPVPSSPNMLNRKPWSVVTCLALGSAVLVSTVLSTGYFVGMTPADVLAHVQAGDSLYAEYQSYNQELAILGGTGLSSWFALLVFRMATMLSAVFTIIPRGDRILPREWIMLACVVLSHAYSGLARGTGLEFFQLGTVLLIAFLMRSGRRRVSAGRTFLIVGLGLCLAILYSSLLAARGMTNPSLGPGNEVQFDKSWLSSLLGPGAVQFLLTFFDYFGFGFQFVATFWSEVWSASLGNMLAGLLPGGYHALGMDPLTLTRGALEMGPRWQPDSIRIISVLGVTGLLLICFALGHLARKLETRSTLASRILRYFVVLQMISLPIGNFVWVDRSSLVVALWLIGIELLREWGAIPPTFREFFGRDRGERSSRTAMRSAPSRIRAGGLPTSTPKGGSGSTGFDLERH